MPTKSVARELAPAGLRSSPLTFIDDQRWVVDLSQDLQEGPGLQPLLDPEIFASVILGDHGWSVEWPEPDIQIGADTLYLEMLAQRSSPHPA
ncbi:DUF2442 domain-containing protein [Pseudomonas sp. MWU12-2115]|nr:DUF2442 domain-containing protein [Pseudomonas sp. MWU12-2115]